MKHLLLTAAMALMITGCARNKPASDATPAPVTQASAKPINAYCPIDRGQAIDPKVTYLYQGRLIGFCCEPCIDEFKKDPDKYMKDLK